MVKWVEYEENISKSTWVCIPSLSLLKNLLVVVIETILLFPFVGKTYMMHAKQCHEWTNLEGPFELWIAEAFNCKLTAFAQLKSFT